LIEQHTKVGLDPGQMPETRKVERWRGQRDEAYVVVESVLDQHDDWKDAVESTFIENPFNNRREYTLPDGRKAIDEVDPRGNVRTTTNAVLRDGQVVTIDPQEAAEAETTMRQWIDEIHDAREDQQDAGRLGRLAEELDDDGLRQQATTRKASADERLQKMRDTVPHDQWQSFELGRFDPIKAAVAPAVESLRNGKLDETLTMFSNMTKGERYEFMQQVGDLPGGLEIYDDLIRRTEGE